MVDEARDDDLEVDGVGGYDNDVDTLRNPSIVCQEFIRALAARWPMLYVDVADDVTSSCRRIDLEGVASLQLPRHGVLFIYRDSDMEAFTEAKGGMPMPDGEGTLALWFRPLESPAEGYHLDLVTPAAPDCNEFSRWVLQKLTTVASG